MWTLFATLARTLGLPWMGAGKVLGWVATGTLGLSFLGVIGTGAGPATGIAVVHVPAGDVVVTVGGRRFEIDERRYEPLLVEVPRGINRLEMSRGGETIFVEEFEVEGGDSCVLTAWAPGSQPPSVTIGPEGPAGEVADPLGRGPDNPGTTVTPLHLGDGT